VTGGHLLAMCSRRMEMVQWLTSVLVGDTKGSGAADDRSVQRQRLDLHSVNTP